MRSLDCITHPFGYILCADYDADASAADYDAFRPSDDHAFGHAACVATSHADSANIADCDATAFNVGIPDTVACGASHLAHIVAM